MSDASKLAALSTKPGMTNAMYSVIRSSSVQFVALTAWVCSLSLAGGHLKPELRPRLDLDAFECIVDETGCEFGGIARSHGLTGDHVGAHVLFEEVGHVVDGATGIECIGHERGDWLIPEHGHLGQTIGVGGMLADDEQAMHPGADTNQVGGRYLREIEAIPWAHNNVVAPGSELSTDVLGGPFGIARSAAIGHENVHKAESTAHSPSKTIFSDPIGATIQPVGSEILKPVSVVRRR